MGRLSDFMDRGQVGDSVRFITGAATISTGDRSVQCTSNTTYPSYAVTLPNVAEAIGQTVSVRATIANSQAVTLQDNDDSLDWTNLTLDADADNVLLYSDGRKWFVLVNDIA